MSKKDFTQDMKTMDTRRPSQVAAAMGIDTDKEAAPATKPGAAPAVNPERVEECKRDFDRADAERKAAAESAELDAKAGTPAKAAATIKEQAAEIERLKAALQEAQDANEPKSQRVSFAIRPSRFYALQAVAIKTGEAQASIVERALKNEYKIVFQGAPLPTAEDIKKMKAAAAADKEG